MQDLTTSMISRQNVLNNRFAVEAIQQHTGVEGMLFENEYLFTKEMVASFFNVEVRTIERYLEQYGDELKSNGYVLFKGKRLKEFKLQFAPVINVGSKTTQLGLFNFRSFLNLAMLLTESENARKLRSAILDITIDTLNKRSGGGTRYINRRDVNYLNTATKEANYRKVLTSAINDHVDGHYTYKYNQVTDIVYKAVFRENAKEYRELLKLDSTDNVRHTLYAEVLLTIASIENALGTKIKQLAAQRGCPLKIQEVQQLVDALVEDPLIVPVLEDARTKMASRDLSFRDVLHGRMQEYLRSVSPDEFEQFIGEKSIDFDKLLEENKDVLERLK